MKISVPTHKKKTNQKIRNNQVGIKALLLISDYELLHAK